MIYTPQENIRISMLGLPIIQNLDDFSSLIGISKYTIYQLSFNSDSYYKTYSIPKKNGKLRLIHQPSKKLKGLQSWVLRNILDKLHVSKACKGFEKGSSIVNNVEPHKNSSTILTIDIKDFFPSIPANYIYNVFKAVGYNNLISTILTNICTYKNTLPQGSPCSPKLANLIAIRIDKRIQGYVGKRGLTYTRYADDLTISGYNPSKISGVIHTIKLILKDEKFEINDKKTRLFGSSRRKQVTGLIISNDGNYGIGKIKYKLLRAKIHKLTFEGTRASEKEINHIKGWISYIKSVDGKRYKKVLKYIEVLKEKHKLSDLMKL